MEINESRTVKISDAFALKLNMLALELDQFICDMPRMMHHKRYRKKNLIRMELVVAQRRINCAVRYIGDCVDDRRKVSV